MSSQPFEDLASTLDAFADAIGAIVSKYPRGSAPSSGGERDCAMEPFAGGWGKMPSQTAIGLALMSIVTCVDHLRAAAALIKSRNAITSPYTVMRGAVEAAARASYLLELNIDAEERVRRGMNFRLEGLQDSLKVLRLLEHDPSAASRMAHLEARVEEIERTAANFGFVFRKAKGRPAYLSSPLPSITELIDACASDVPDLGRTYYQRLSAVAHSRPHGLMDLMKRTAVTGGPEDAPVLPTLGMNVTPAECALELLAGPLCAMTVVDHCEKYLGWDTVSVERPTVNLTNVWGRITQTPFPGPQFSDAPPTALQGGSQPA